jgi:hypothetical protein
MADGSRQAERIGEFIVPLTYASSMVGIGTQLHFLRGDQAMRVSFRSGFSDELVEAHDSFAGPLFGFLCAAAVSVALWTAIGWGIFILLA